MTPVDTPEAAGVVLLVEPPPHPDSAAILIISARARHILIIFIVFSFFSLFCCGESMVKVRILPARDGEVVWVLSLTPFHPGTKKPGPNMRAFRHPGCLDETHRLSAPSSRMV
jgi:hypothetical protein